MKRAVAVAVVLVIVASGCRRAEKQAEVKNHDPAPVVPQVVDPDKLYVTTSTENDARVRQAFPKGVASEDARSIVGSAPPPPEERAPDPSSEVVVATEPAKPVDLATVRAALKGRPEGAMTFIKGMTADGKWDFVEDPGATGPYTRVAVEVHITEVEKPTPQANIEREIAWARTGLAKLDKRVTTSMTSAQAVARATAAFDLRRSLTDDAVDVGVAIVAPQGKKLAGRLVWDVVYSAGFRWGDGDYFHWVPSLETDVSQGISMGTSTGSSYFMPEWVAKNDGRADVDDLEMSFDVARTYEPEAVFDVMVRAAKYMARRLGGTLVDHDGKPFDEAAARARVTSIVSSMKAANLTPGWGLALEVF